MAEPAASGTRPLHRDGQAIQRLQQRPIVMGVRDAKKLIGVSKDTAHMALRFLEDRGFVVCTKRGAFSHKTCMDASEWRLTEYDSDYPVQHATKEFMRRTEFKTRPEFRKRSKILGPSSPKN
jgi:DeoR/GlpR family transcriptional regulator of sugar metabolism